MVAKHDYYYITRTPDRDGCYRIHCGRCQGLPSIIHRYLLGLFGSSNDAVKEAGRKGYAHTSLHACSCNHCIAP
jgi:hypothetical protein